MWIVFFLLFKSSLSQATCFSVAQTSGFIPEFASSNVLSSTSFNDSRSFEAYLAGKADTNPEYQADFRQFFNCNNWNGQDQRFHMSYFASFILYSSAVPVGPCPAPPLSTRMTLCRDTCVYARQALESLFNNPNVCAPLPFNATGNRERTLKSYEDYCNALPVSNTNEGRCLPGLNIEMRNCGFYTLENAQQHCNSQTRDREKDTCCNYLGQNNVNWLFDASIRGTATPNSNSNSKWYLYIGIACGAVLVVAALIALGYLVYKRLQQRRKRRKLQELSPFSSASNLSVKSPAKSPFDYSLSYSPSTSPSAYGQFPPQEYHSPLPEKPLTVNTTPLTTPTISTFSQGENKSPKPKKVNQTKKVIHTYAPFLADECPLNVGDIVVIEKLYDDGWGVGRNTTTGASGAFPLACLADLSAPIARESFYEREKRHSSLPR